MTPVSSRVSNCSLTAAEPRSNRKGARLFGRDRPEGPSDDIDVQRRNAMNGRTATKRELSKRGKKPSTYRRVVTENVNGKSVVQSDGPMEAYEFRTVPGYEHALIWVNPTTPDLSKEQRFDSYPDSVVPGALHSTIRHFAPNQPAYFALCRLPEN